MTEDEAKVEALRWMPSGYLRFFQPKNGDVRLEQLWEGVANREREWRPVPTVSEDQVNADLSGTLGSAGPNPVPQPKE